jgi:hypothetical protein
MANSVTITLKVNDNASGVLRGLQGILGQNAIAGAAMGGAITGAINGAKAAVGGLTSALSEAADIQNSNISTAGDFMKMTGKSYAESIGFVDDFTKRMAKLAAALPGQTKDYVTLGKGLTDNLIPAFQNLDGTLQDASFAKSLDSITKNAALRVANTDATTRQASLAISKALSGSASVKGLSRLKFFQENPAVLSAIEKEAARLGTKLEKMTDRQRAEVIEKALAVPGEVIKASQESIKGLVEGFRSSLFDPQIGLFGLLRDTDIGLSGDQSVLAALSVTAMKVLGPGGLFAQIGETLKLLGLSTDPMAALFRGVTSFNAWLDGLNIAGLAGQLVSMDGGKLGKMASGLQGQMINWLLGLDWHSISDAVGNAIAGLANYVGAMVLNFPVSDAVALGFVIFAAIGRGLITAFQGLDSNFWLGALKGLGLVLAGMLIFSFVAGFGGVVIAIAGAIAFLVTTIVQDWELIRTTWAQWFGQIDEAMGFAFSWVIGRIGEGAKFVTDSISNLFKAIAEKIANLIPDIPNPLRAGTGVRKGFGTASKGPKVPTAATGLNFGGLFGALAREMAAMPSGASPVVANSAETILNPRQVAGLIAGIQGLGRGGGASGGMTIGNIIINAGATTDPQALAQQVMAEIEREWQRFSNSKLSPAY